MSFRLRPFGLLLAAALLAPTMHLPAAHSAAASTSHKSIAGASQGYPQFQRLKGQAQAALKAGNPARASSLAGQILRENTDKSSWYYGDVVYEANQLLGLAALRQGNINAAKQYLLAAGRTPGSAVLDSFGPEMPLAQALLAQGQKQTVLTFLSLVAKFWATPKSSQDQFRSLYASHGATLHKWERQIRAGKTASLDRYDFRSAPSPPSSPAPVLLAAGTAAPNFTVNDRAGSPVKLSDFKGKVVVLDFWATWCPPCQKSLPHTNAVAKQFADQGVTVLAVCVSDTQAAFDGWLPRHPEYDSIRFAFDPAKQGGPEGTGRLYHVTGIPTQYVIGKDGKVITSFVGYGGPTTDLADALMRATSAAPKAQSASAR